MLCQSKCGFNLFNFVLDDSTDIVWNVTQVLWTLANEVAHDRHVCVKCRELMVIDGGLNVDCVGCSLKQDIFYTLFVFSKLQKTASWSAAGNLSEKFPTWLSTCSFSRFIQMIFTIKLLMCALVWKLELLNPWYNAFSTEYGLQK